MLSSRTSLMQFILLIFLNFTLVYAKGGRGGGGGGRSSRGSKLGGGTSFTKNPGVIAGTVVACVAFVVMSIVGVLWRRKRRLAMAKEKEIEEAEDQMPYAQRVAMEDALALQRQLEAEKRKGWFR